MAKAAPDRVTDFWDTLAFLARYGHQQLSGMMDEEVLTLGIFARAIGRLVRQESQRDPLDISNRLATGG